MNVCFGEFGQLHSVAGLRFWPLEPFLFYFIFSQNNTVSKVLGNMATKWAFQEDILLG
jgi:hypothetical protein